MLQDDFALRSHTLAAEATEKGLLNDVISYKVPGFKMKSHNRKYFLIKPVSFPNTKAGPKDVWFRQASLYK
jgi:acetyl-CoA acetyltransferase